MGKTRRTRRVRVEVVDSPLPFLAGMGGNRDLRAEAWLQPGDLVLEDIHHDPDLAQIGNGEHLGLFADIHAIAGHHPGDDASDR